MPFKSNIFKSALIYSTVISATLTACSHKTEHQFIDRTDTGEISDVEKQQFEKNFFNQCIERETKNSINKDIDKKRFEKSCLCIAKRVMRSLTAKEAEKFLAEHKNTQSLRISFDKAAYFCMQNKAMPKALPLFGRKNHKLD